MVFPVYLGAVVSAQLCGAWNDRGADASTAPPPTQILVAASLLSQNATFKKLYV